LILLLIPSPFFFRLYLAELISLIREARLKKIGPLEFEQGPLPEEIHQLVNQEAQRAAAFIYLDFWLIPRTKVILIWIADKRSVGRAEFEVYATSVGVPAENMEATLQALLLSGCVIPQTDGLTITDWGNQYVGHMLAQVNRGGQSR
jgi:hypothetical protein